MIWGGAEAVRLSTAEQLQTQIITGREVWLHRAHNKSIACRLISKPYQWVASENKLRAPTDSALWWVVQLFHYMLQCNNNRNKVHNKCNALELSQNHPPTPALWKNCLPRNWPLVPKRLGTADVRYFPLCPHKTALRYTEWGSGQEQARFCAQRLVVWQAWDSPLPWCGLLERPWNAKLLVQTHIVAA